MITMIHTTLKGVEYGLAEQIIRYQQSSGGLTTIDQSTKAGVGPSGLAFTCYRQVLRFPLWMKTDAVCSASLKEDYPHDHELAAHIGETVRRKRSHACLSMNHSGGATLWIEGESLALVNRLFSDIMLDRVVWS